MVVYRPLRTMGKNMARYIYMVRHGEPEAGFTKRYLGRLDPGLSPEGAAQAARAAERVKPLAPQRCFSSPLLRARDTAQVIADACGLAVEPTDLLLEINFGLLEGLTFKEASALYPKATDSWQALSDDFTFPEGENFFEFNRRAARMAALARESAEERVLLVAHGGVLRGVLCNLLGVEADGPLRFRPSYAALTTVEIGDGGYAVLAGFNVGREEPYHP